MKIYITLILSCASVMGADTGIRVATTTTTVGLSNSVEVVTQTFSDGTSSSATAISTPFPAGVSNCVIFQKDVFTRDGQTNLVCDTRIKGGTLLVRSQSFYHDGQRVGESLVSHDVQDFVSEAGSPYSMRYRSRSIFEPGFVYISAKDGSLVDMFTCTNGVYYPAESRLIAERNDAIKHARDRIK